MNTGSRFLDRVQEVCHEIGQASSLESLYENLVHFISKASGYPASALMTGATYGAAGNSFRVTQGTGRFSVTHKLQHASFAETIQEVRWQYQQGFSRRINQEVLLFLRNWLGKHILVEDMKYAALLGGA